MLLYHCNPSNGTNIGMELKLTLARSFIHTGVDSTELLHFKQSYNHIQLL